jgi:hypothetical protein
VSPRFLYSRDTIIGCCIPSRFQIIDIVISIYIN